MRRGTEISCHAYLNLSVGVHHANRGDIRSCVWTYTVVKQERPATKCPFPDESPYLGHFSLRSATNFPICRLVSTHSLVSPSIQVHHAVCSGDALMNSFSQDLRFAFRQF